MAQPHPSSSSSAQPLSSPWVILGSIPRVSALADAGDVSVALAAPPRVSILTVSPRVFPDFPVRLSHIYKGYTKVYDTIYKTYTEAICKYSLTPSLNLNYALKYKVC